MAGLTLTGLMAAGGGAAGAAGSLGPGAIIAGGASAFGALQQVRAGEMESQRLRSQAMLESARGRMERIRGEQESNEIRARLNRTMAQNIASSFASGIALDSGAVRQGMTVAQQQAGRELAIQRVNTELATFASNLQARQLRLQARHARTGGRQQAVMGLLQTAERFATRGRPGTAGAGQQLTEG